MLVTGPKTVLFICKEIKGKLDLSVVMDLTAVPQSVIRDPRPLVTVSQADRMQPGTELL